MRQDLFTGLCPFSGRRRTLLNLMFVLRIQGRDKAPGRNARFCVGTSEGYRSKKIAGS
ncbi:hypothetical protein AOE01nite_20790 [Acetobacter oeni]|uniref:Uncharacterized protein n=1 Tax=Acetobacter oeni TaxID=304077 RepID=A0A511XLN1_9PROT|nr:hypothetical protein AOE01nite_20790 [Acetobacter oeni]